MRVVAVVLALLAAPALAQDQPRLPPTLAAGETLLEVEATGSVKSRPDIVTFGAGVVTTGRSAESALSANSVLTEKLIAALKTEGIRPEDIRTSNLSVEPRFKGNRDEEVQPVILGYVARNTLKLRVRDPGRAGAILSRLLETGANEVSGPEFALADDRANLQRARAAAIDEARNSASAYARAMGLRVGRILRVTERARRIERDATIVVTGALRTAAPIEPGELESHITVWVDFALTHDEQEKALPSK